MLSFVRNHPIAVGAGAAVVLAGLAWLAFGFFGVHTLFVDDVVDEAGPVFDATPAARPPEPDDPPAPPTTAPTIGAATNDASTDAAVESDAPAPEPTTTAGGETGADAAAVLPATSEPAEEPAGPEITTEFAGTFEGDAHPTTGWASVLGNGTGQRFLRLEDFETDNGPDLNVYLVNSSTGDVSDHVDLGDLKGNIGDQNYEIPADVDLTVYDEVVIWCVRFGVGFGDAVLTSV